MGPLVRCACLLLVAATASCALDKQGTGSLDELQSDAAVDSDLFDGSTADTSVPDTTVATDSFMPPDVPVDTIEAAVDTGPPFCDPSDLTLIACYRFEGNGSDGSSHMNDLTVTGGTYVAGVDGQAISISPTTQLMAIENPTFGVTSQLTLELWVRLRSVPVMGRMGLIDDDGRFGFFIYPPGVARAMSPTPVDTAAPLTTGTWTHLAYTFDGENMTLFVNGKVSVVRSITATFGPASGAGVAIGGNSPSGDPLDGDIDSVRIFRIARTPAQICAAAGAC